MGGAVERAWYALARQFALQGHRVTHLSRQHPKLPAADHENGVLNLRVPGFETPSSLLKLKLLDLVFSWRLLRVLPVADILVTHTFWLPVLLRNRRHGNVYVHVGRYPKGQMRFYGAAARLQTVSNPIADAIRQEVPQAANRVCVIPYPLASQWFQASVSAPAEQRNTVLYVGRIHPEKGLELLLQAWAILLRQVEVSPVLRLVGPWQTNLGGGGEIFQKKLETLAKPLGKRVEFCGPIFDEQDLIRAYDQAAVFVYPSLAAQGETFGLAPLEAMARGCVPVVSNLGCFKDFIMPGKNGHIFNHDLPSAAQDLATVLRQAWQNSAKRQMMSQAAIARARLYHLDIVAQKYLADFSSLIAPPDSQFVERGNDRP